MGKKIISRILTLAMVVFMSVSISSCGDTVDEEPVKTKTPKEIYDWNMSRLVGKDGTILLYKDGNVPDTYYLAMETAQQAHKVCENIIGKSWDGERASVDLGTFGNITVMPSDEAAAFCKVNYDLTDLAPLTMVIAPKAYIMNDNSAAEPPVEVKDWL